MAYILHIETTSTVCSVSISYKNELIALKEQNGGYTHAENLHLFITSIISEVQLYLSQLEAISISKGPGSYTGLRIGYATAKGLCYALNIPLIEIETLQALSALAKNTTSKNETIFCPLIDARRMEVYYALYDYNLTAITPAKALIIDVTEIKNLINQYPHIVFLGDGMPKTRDFITQLNLQASYINDIMPTSKSLIELAYNKFQKNDFVDIAYAEPFYLKEFYFTTSKKGT